MLDTIITNKTRIKLLLKFFLNNETTSYLRKLESEFGESTNSIRIELNRLESAGLLDAFHTGNKKFYKANTQHPLYNDLNSIIRKFIGIDRIIEKIALQTGELKAVYLTGDIARGIDSNSLELILIGNDLDTPYISNLVKKAKRFISRNIKYKIYPMNQADAILRQDHIFLIWQENDNPFYAAI
ncbi:MAG: ArsR family transcriptional regulator [Bacteroidetes bacterium]|nr:ArsR family transcriptional regulator [Bacteroidota bacterium]